MTAKVSNSSKPSSAMQKAAAEGIQLHSGGSFPDVTPAALEMGKKIAAGQGLNGDHITDIVHYHSAHDKCPAGDCEDLLWGGPAGYQWSKSKLLQSMRTGFSEENIDFDKLISDKDTKLSFEVYSATELDEPVDKEADSDGLIWRPILRSGMLATRPGPNGEKLDQPLIFVPGHSENQRKEIGLQDVVDAFKDNAIEYVTIPIDTIKDGEDIPAHSNKTFQNTGFIKDVKMVDSKKVPGEKVILGGHKFTEPDIKEKIDRGTIPSRSCGLLYDYKNTTTGKEYPVVLEHMALTHKPWMGGMAAYGEVSEMGFADRTIVPMMLSEKPFVAKEVEVTQPTKLAQETTEPSHSKDNKEVKSEFLADIQWGSEPSYRDIEKQIEQILDSFGGDFDSYPNYFLIDCSPDKALIKVNYGIGSDNDAWVAPYKCTDGKVELAPFADWIDVQKKWVNDTEDPDKDREQLDKLKMSDTNLAVLTTKARNNLPSSAFVYPADKRYPIHDIAHGRNALARVAQNGTPEEQAKVRAAVYRKYPELKKNSDSKSNMSDDPLKLASEKRSNNKPIGGNMTLLVMSEEKMELLGLSDEAKEFHRQQNAEIQKMATKLAETQKKEKETRVANRLTELKGEGLDAFPAILMAYEATALSDDGDIAVKLQLSENGHGISVPETATELAERFIKAIPRKDGIVDLGEQANKLETPDTSRPDLSPDDPNKQDKPKDGDALLAEWAEADPTLLKDPAFTGLKLSENGKGQ